MVHIEEVLVIPAVLALLGDNPMQSELACHMGMAARLFCWVCWVSSGDAVCDEDDGEEILEQGASPGCSNATCGSESGVTTWKHTRVMERLGDMVNRVKWFMKARNF